MRHLLLALMIALLPVRGWSSGAMAVSMAAQSVNTIKIIASHSYSMRAYDQSNTQIQTSMPAECPMLAHAPDGSSTPAPAALFHGCNVCQLCMAVVTGYPMTLVAAASLPQATPAVGKVSFASALRAPGFKPPIS
jgi:hypothetical protein